MNEKSVQEIQREVTKKNDLAKWYLSEAYKVAETDKKNGIGIAFWLLMEQLTLKENL